MVLQRDQITIDKLEISEEIFKHDRWYVVLKNSRNGQKTIVKARYIWLKANPAFKEIPKGYVIHHLDHDELNDDPTNLALMQKYIHNGYHSKHMIVAPEIKVDLGVPFVDGKVKNINIYKNNKREDRWFLKWHRKGEVHRLFTYNDKVITSEKEAKAIKKELMAQIHRYIGTSMALTGKR